MNENLAVTMRKLRLSGMAETIDIRLQEATANGLSHEEFLELILQDEEVIRKQRQLARRIKVADFRDKKTLEDFDWSFNKMIKRKRIYDLASCQFMNDKNDILFVGPPGVGKSHICQAIGYQAIKMGHIVLYRSIFDLVRDFLKDEAFAGEEKVMKKYLRPDLLIIDDMGMKSLPKKSGEYLFEIVMRRHELRSTIMTSNRPIEDWGKLLQDVPAATAILDRFLPHAEVISITGKSYRLKNQQLAQKKPND